MCGVVVYTSLPSVVRVVVEVSLPFVVRVVVKVCLLSSLGD